MSKGGVPKVKHLQSSLWHQLRIKRMTQQALQQPTLPVLQQFMQVVLENWELQEKLKVVADWESFVRRLVDLGKQSGYFFSSEDVEVMLQYREMAGFTKPIWEREIAQFRAEQSRGAW